MFLARTWSPALNLAGAGAGRPNLPRTMVAATLSYVSLPRLSGFGGASACPAATSSAVMNLVEQQVLEPEQPLFVVRARQIDTRGQRLANRTARCSMLNAPAAPIARTIASTRASHAVWNIGSFGSTSTLPKPSMPPMSCTPFMMARPAVLGKPVPIIVVGAVDQFGELRFRSSLRCRRDASATPESASRRWNPTREFSVSFRQTDAENPPARRAGLSRHATGYGEACVPDSAGRPSISHG